MSDNLDDVFLEKVMDCFCGVCIILLLVIIIYHVIYILYAINVLI